MKALFCGLGSIGQRHLRNLRTLVPEDLELLAFRARAASPVLNPDMTVRHGADLESTYGIRSFRSLDEALNERPDVVFVTNPNTEHLPVALAAARAGCHLFIEKPLSHSIDGVEELSDLVRDKGLVAFVAYQFRFHPGLRFIKQLIDEKRLGNTIAAHIVNGEYLPDWHPYEDYRQTHPARRDLGGGCLSIQTHELDFALWLFGMPSELFAIGGHLSNLEIDVEDSVSLLLRCEHDGRPIPVHVHLDYLQRPPQRRCEVIGDEGKGAFDYYGNEVRFHDRQSGITDIRRFDRFDRNQMFLDELRHFLDCVGRGVAPLVDLAEGIRSLRIAEAAQESLRRGDAVVLAEGR